MTLSKMVTHVLQERRPARLDMFSWELLAVKGVTVSQFRMLAAIKLLCPRAIGVGDSTEASKIESLADLWYCPRLQHAQNVQVRQQKAFYQDWFHQLDGLLDDVGQAFVLKDSAKTGLDDRHTPLIIGFLPFLPR